jgi:hypothetical protein
MNGRENCRRMTTLGSERQAQIEKRAPTGARSYFTIAVLPLHAENLPQDCNDLDEAALRARAISDSPTGVPA